MMCRRNPMTLGVRCARFNTQLGHPLPGVDESGPYTYRLRYHSYERCADTPSWKPRQHAGECQQHRGDAGGDVSAHGCCSRQHDAGEESNTRLS